VDEGSPKLKAVLSSVQTSSVAAGPSSSIFISSAPVAKSPFAVSPKSSEAMSSPSLPLSALLGACSLSGVGSGSSFVS